jgi:hypothetical protein
MRLIALHKRGIALALGTMVTLQPLFAFADHRQAFVGGLEDLPLMDGLAEDRSAGLIFDKPDGRLVDAFAYGPITAEAVRTFYRDTLPELGWRVVGPLTFEREGERLRIDIESAENGVMVRFHLAPQ